MVPVTEPYTNQINRLAGICSDSQLLQPFYADVFGDGLCETDPEACHIQNVFTPMRCVLYRNPREFEANN
jgi:hypothetical protein